MLCTNTMHAVCDGLEQAGGVPFLHIADATAAALKSRGFTRWAVGHPLYHGPALLQGQAFGAARHPGNHPAGGEFPEIYRVITEELTFHKIKEASRAYYLSQIEALARRGARGSFWAVPRFRCSFSSSTPPFRSLTPPPFTPWRRWSWPTGLDHREKSQQEAASYWDFLMV